MLKQRKRLVAVSLYLADMVVVAAAFFTAYWIRFSYMAEFELGGLYSVDRYLWILLSAMAFFSFFLYRYGAYRSFRSVPFFSELKIVCVAIALGGVVLFASAFALKSYYLSRLLVGIFIVVSAVFVSLERLAIRSIGHYARRKGLNYRNVLIVGIGGSAAKLFEKMENNREWGIRVVGFLSENASDIGSYFLGRKVLGRMEDLERIVKEEVIDEVVFTPSGKGFSDIEDSFLMLEDLGINARVAMDFFPHTKAKAHLEELDNVPLLTFSTITTDAFSLAVKRFFDFALSLILLLLTMPIMLATAVLIRLESHGAAFFAQERCGRNGRVFTMYKFRSMVKDAEFRLMEFEDQNEMKGPAFKMKDDPRVTAVGRFIRRTSIDELPQLWNVLRGDMSLIGPRPPLVREVANYARWQRRRLSMKPGLTCLWQISGRNSITDFDEWAKLDLEYIDRWSLLLDLKIFLKTIPAVFFGRGAA
ncbi:MAG: sugar transferase [Thermodesulfobacteriota bacterium]